MHNANRLHSHCLHSHRLHSSTVAMPHTPVLPSMSESHLRTLCCWHMLHVKDSVDINALCMGRWKG